MDYKEKYQDALDLARTFYEGYIIQGHNDEAGILAEIFSELKESEDEKIRKAILEHIQLCTESIPDRDKFIAWLEKQKEFVSADFDDVWETADCDELIAPLEKYSKDAIKKMCHAWYDKGIELERRNWLNQAKQELGQEKSEDERIRKGLINGFKECLEDCQYPKNAVKYWHDVEVDSILVWLERQGEKTTEKVEPKFKVGDWITDGYVGGLITSIEDNYPCYKIADFMGGINTSIPFTLQDNYHLWTIEDAKDGDVLVNSKGNPFIFTGKFTTNYHNPIAYCGIGNENKFIVCALNWRFHWAEKKEVLPATKEQRDLLFQKMAKAGYEWDPEKKELKKMEVASKESEDDRIRKGIIRNLQFLMDRSEGFVQEDLQERIAWLENQCEQKQTWKPSIAQKIVIKELIEDKNTSNAHRVILRGMLDEFKQFTNNYKRETDNYETEDSSQT